MRWLDDIRLSGHEFEQTLGDGEGQGSLVCCGPWGRKELETMERRQQLATHPQIPLQCCSALLWRRHFQAGPVIFPVPHVSPQCALDALPVERWGLCPLP